MNAKQIGIVAVFVFLFICVITTAFAYIDWLVSIFGLWSHWSFAIFISTFTVTGMSLANVAAYLCKRVR